MRLKGHLVSAAPLGLVVGWAAGSAQAGLAAALAAGLLDGDHVLDYVVSNGRFESLGHMFRYCYRGRLKRFLLLAHAYEVWLVGLWLLPLWLPPSLVQGLLAGWLLHLVLDQLFNPVNPWTYFLGWRLAHRFEASAVLTPGRNLFTDLALMLSLPRPRWTQPWLS